MERRAMLVLGALLCGLGLLVFTGAGRRTAVNTVVDVGVATGGDARERALPWWLGAGAVAAGIGLIVAGTRRPSS